MFCHDDGNAVGGRGLVWWRWSDGRLLGVLQPPQHPGQGGDVRAGVGPGHHTHSNIVLSPRPAPVGIKPAVWPVRLPSASFPGAELVAENVVTTEIEI